VLVFRIDGLQGLEAARGQESANVVRRKVAVRLRAGVRSSDVVASLGLDAFAVLLSSTESPADATHVVDKLQRWLREPVSVTGTSVALSTFVGVAQFPKDGRQPDELLRHASAAAMLGAYGMQPDAANAEPALPGRQAGLAGRAGPEAQPFARHILSTGQDVSGLSPSGGRSAATGGLLQNIAEREVLDLDVVFDAMA